MMEDPRVLMEALKRSNPYQWEKPWLDYHKQSLRQFRFERNQKRIAMRLKKRRLKHQQTNNNEE